MAALNEREAQKSPTRRAVLYLRQSVAREESISLELQETAGRDYCARQGYEVVAVEADEGISGRRWNNRPAVSRVMGMIENGQADVIVLWKWSRLSRSRLDWAIAVDAVETHGGRIESATEPVDITTSTGRLARGMLAEFAAFESERIGEVWKESHARRLKRGLPHSGQPRFAYVKQEDGTYVPDPDLAPLLIEMYRRAINREPWYSMARWLNQNGYKNARGNSWQVRTLITVLDAGFGAGYLARNYPRPTYERGAQEPIISEEMWQQYLEMRKQARGKGPERMSETNHCLKGLIFCSICGRRMSVYLRTTAKRGYRCMGGLRGYADHSSVTCDMKLAEQAVWDAIQETLQQVQATPVENKVVSFASSAQIERKIASVGDQIGKLTVAWSAGKILDEAYERAIQSLTSERDELEKQRSETLARNSARKNFESIALNIVDNWNVLTPNEQNLLLRKILRGVYVGQRNPGDYYVPLSVELL